MKTHELELIKTIDELNLRNDELRAANRRLHKMALNQLPIWNYLGIGEAGL